MHIINYDNCPFPTKKFRKKHRSGKKTAFYTFNLDAAWFWFYDAQLKITLVLLIDTNDQSNISP